MLYNGNDASITLNITNRRVKHTIKLNPPTYNLIRSTNWQQGRNTNAELTRYLLLHL